MKCPICRNDSKVTDTRTNDDGSSTRRRRECMSCGFRFTTYEKIEDKPLIVLKKSGRSELFDGTKILKGLAKACEKRPITLEQQEALVDAVEKSLQSQSQDGYVTSAQIGQTVMDQLIVLDQVAYVRFASVYKEFNDVETFIHEIEGLKK